MRTSNFNTTIGSYLTTTAFNNTSTSQLTLKQNKNIYTIPNIASSWILLGTITTTQTGNITAIDLYSNANSVGYAWDEIRETIQFSTSNGTSSSQNGNDGTPFYGEATIIITNGNVNINNFAIQQVSATSYKLLFLTSSTPGNGIFNIKTNDTFTYSGTTTTLTGCYIYPKTLYTYGLDYSNNCNLNIDGITSSYINANSNLYGNTCNTNFLSLSNNKGQLYNYDYTLFSSLILQHPYAMQFSINGAVPPLQTSNTNILMTMDASNGIDVNCFLACETSLSVLGETNLIGNVISNITCTKSLNISGNSLLRSNLTVSGTSNFNNVIVNNNITARTLFIIGTSTSFINSNNMLNINGIANGVNLYNGANQVAMFNSSQISLQYNTKLLQSKTSDNSFIIQNTLSGPSSLHLFSNTTLGSRIYQNPDGNLNVSVNVSGTSILPLSIYSNGVINCNASNAVNHKQLVLYESGAADTPSTATNFYGFGINSQTLRYQVAQTTHTHKFYCGSTLGFTITNTGGSPTSDLRFKSNINNINNALDKINQMQGKTFIMFNDDSKPQIGFIAQDLINVLPEVVVVDSSDDHYMSIQYDKITSLLNEGIKELYKEIQILKNRIDILENK